MTTHFFSDVIVHGKRSGLPRTVILLGLIAAAIALGGWIFIMTHIEAPAPLAPRLASPLPVARHAAPRLGPSPRPIARSEADTLSRVQPGEPAKVEALPEIDPFEGVERVDPSELDGISQAH